MAACGATVAAAAFLMELSVLPGRAAIDGVPLTVLDKIMSDWTAAQRA